MIPDKAKLGQMKSLKKLSANLRVLLAKTSKFSVLQ